MTLPVMSLSATSLPRGFSWLRGTPRPSADEVDLYTHLIADAEGYTAESPPPRLHDEAELQLWTWQAETYAHPRSRR